MLDIAIAVQEFFLPLQCRKSPPGRVAKLPEQLSLDLLPATHEAPVISHIKLIWYVSNTQIQKHK